MSGWRDQILTDAIGSDERTELDRPRREPRVMEANNRRGGVMRLVSRFEQERREVSGLPHSARQRAWKGGLR